MTPERAERKRQLDQEYYQANRESILERVKAYEYPDPDARKEYMTSYYESNKDKMLEQNRALRQSKLEETRAYDRKRATPERRRRHYLTQQVPRRAKCKEHAIYPEVWSLLLAYCGGSCLRCGGKSNIEIDHVVPLSMNGINRIDNAQPLCRSCNAHKRQESTDYRTEAQRDYARSLAESDSRTRRGRSRATTRKSKELATTP